MQCIDLTDKFQFISTLLLKAFLTYSAGNVFPLNIFPQEPCIGGCYSSVFPLSRDIYYLGALQTGQINDLKHCIHVK